MKALLSNLKSPLSWFLLFVPLAWILEVRYTNHALMIFLVSGIAVIPLAGFMGRATESLSATMGAGIGALINSTLGNAAELIIAYMFLRKGPEMYPLVKASITGSIVGNILLVLGLSFIAGGIKHRTLRFNAAAAGMGTTLLALASIGLILPSLYFYITHLSKTESALRIEYLSEEIAFILGIIYLLSLVFSLVTHKNLYTGEEEHAVKHAGEWSRRTSLGVLVLATAGVAVMSEFLVGSVEKAAESVGMTQVFVGVIVISLIGNVAEHSTAIMVALKNKMDLAVNIAIGSSTQVALFVAPILVLTSVALGYQIPLDLHFTPMELVSIILSIGVLHMVVQDGEANWMEGVMLVGVYLILALGFYHLPV